MFHWRFLAFLVFVVAASVYILWDPDDSQETSAEVMLATEDSACRNCHESGTPFIVEDFTSSAMSQSGLVNCTSCHLAQPTDSDAVIHNGYTVTFKPSAKDCSGCHPDQVAQFYQSKHSMGWIKMEATSRYIDLPQEIRGPMCEGCHNIGQFSPDGSVGKCDSCHTRHSFSKDEARKPESCGTCHMGPDHPQIEAYLSSKHGVMYTLENEGWNWSDPTTFTAPVCTTCHMPDGTHNVGFGISIGGTSSGSTITGSPQAFPMGNVSATMFAEKRTEMMEICMECHSGTFAAEALSGADSVKNETDALVGEARKILIELYNDGLLDPMPANRTANPVTGFNLTLMGQQLYSNTSGIETLFFKMYKYHDVTAWKGAYHFSPDYSHWYGYAEANHDLELIKAEDRQLRAMEELRQGQLQPIQSADGSDASATALVLGLAALAVSVTALALSATSRRKSNAENKDEPKQDVGE
jgi:hydroxylamine dehydrogenase